MAVHPQDFWGQLTQFTQQFQKLMAANPSMGQLPQMPNLPGMPPMFGASPVQGLNFDSAKLQHIQQQYLKESTELWQQALSAQTPTVGDRRFSGSAWQQNPVASFAAATYLLNTRTLMEMAEAVEGDEKTKARLRFAVEQWAAASAPSNFLAFNAEAQKKAIDTKGESIAKGVKNLMHDLQ